MPGIFEISQTNPLTVAPVSECYSYYQKYQTDESVTIQILSDFLPTARLIDADTGYVYDPTIPVVLKPTNIVDQTFSVYEITIDFSAVDSGRYRLQVLYTDDLDEDQVVDFHPIEVSDEHPNTLVIDYKNSENNFSIVFDTGIVFRLRVEGDIKEYDPESDDTIYNDQIHNTTLLSSIPYDKYRLFVGPSGGIPPFMRKRVNLAFSCDEKKINNVYYEKIEGAKWEVERISGGSNIPGIVDFAGMQLDITPIENYFLQRIKTGPQPPSGFTPVDKVLNYNGNGDDLTIGGIFKRYSNLEKIAILNRGGAFTLSIGLTPGGTEIGTHDVPAGAASPNDSASVFQVDWYFGKPVTLYLTGLAGTDTDIAFDYQQFDETPIVPGAPSGSVSPVGSVIMYGKDQAAFELDFNISTGLGFTGGDFDGWALCDGRNTTPDLQGLFVPGWSTSAGDYDTVFKTGGANSVVLTLGQMPEHNHAIKSTNSSPSASDFADPVRGNGQGTTSTRGGIGLSGKTIEPAGNNEAHENRPAFKVLPYIMRLV